MKKIFMICIAVSLLLSMVSGVTAASTSTKIQGFEANSLIKANGSFWVWGVTYSVPTQITGLTDVTSSFGRNYVIKSDGTVWIWERTSSSEVNIYPIEGVSNVIASSYHYPMILDVNGNVYELPIIEMQNKETKLQAKLIPNIDNVQDFTDYYNYREGKYQTLFLKKDGTIWTSLDSYKTFEKIPDLNHVVDIEKNFVLKEDETVWVWANDYKQKYTEEEKSAGQILTKIEGLEKIEKIFVGNNTNLAIDNQSRLRFWGGTVTGSSDGTTYHEQPEPILITSIDDVKDAFLIERSIVVYTHDGNIYRSSFEGESMPNDPKFTLIASDVALIKKGNRHIIMQKKDGSLWGWGVNKNADLGYGDFEFMHAKPVPVQPPISIELNGKAIQLNNGAIIKDGQTFIPIRSIFEDLGAVISWDNMTKVATISKEQPGEKPVSINVNYKTRESTLNGEQIILQNEPFINANISYLPLRFISQSLGAKVDWNQQEQKVSIMMQLNSYKALTVTPNV